MQKNQKKSVRFRELLPQIYEKMVIENYSHYQTSVWLKEEHDLDLLGTDGKGKPFSNYLSLYGDIKTAKRSYEIALNKDKTLQAKTWFQPFVSEDKLKSSEEAKRRIDKTTKSEPESSDLNAIDSVKPELEDNSADTADSVKVSARYNIKKKKRVVPDDPFEGFDPNAL